MDLLLSNKPWLTPKPNEYKPKTESKPLVRREDFLLKLEKEKLEREKKEKLEREKKEREKEKLNRERQWK